MLAINQPVSKFTMTDKPSMTTYTASAFTALWGALTFEHIVAIGGLMIGVIGLAVNIYFKRREDQRAHERHMKFMSNNSQAEGEKTD